MKVPYRLVKLLWRKMLRLLNQVVQSFLVRGMAAKHAVIDGRTVVHRLLVIVVVTQHLNTVE